MFLPTLLLSVGSVFLKVFFPYEKINFSFSKKPFHPEKTVA